MEATNTQTKGTVLVGSPGEGAVPAGNAGFEPSTANSELETPLASRSARFNTHWPSSQAEASAIPSAVDTNTYWSTTEEQLLKRLRQQGFVWNDIAKQLPGRSPQAIAHKWKLIEEQNGKKPYKVASKPRTSQAGKLWTDVENQRLIKLKQQGSSWNLIAPKMGRSKVACKFQWNKIKLEGYSDMDDSDDDDLAQQRLSARQDGQSTSGSATIFKKRAVLWSAGEDQILSDAYRKGVHWDTLLEKLPGRTSIACLNRVRIKRLSQKEAQTRDGSKRRIQSQSPPTSPRPSKVSRTGPLGLNDEVEIAAFSEQTHGTQQIPVQLPRGPFIGESVSDVVGHRHGSGPFFAASSEVS